jgi:hypothetical protein
MSQNCAQLAENTQIDTDVVKLIFLVSMWRQLQGSEISCTCLKSYQDTLSISNGHAEASCVTVTVAHDNNLWTLFQNTTKRKSVEYLKRALQVNYSLRKSVPLKYWPGRFSCLPRKTSLGLIAFLTDWLPAMIIQVYKELIIVMVHSKGLKD